MTSRLPDTPPSILKDILVRTLPVAITVIVSVTGAYVALNSQVAGLSSEVGRLGRIVDRLDDEAKHNVILASEVKKLTTAVDRLATDAAGNQIRDVQSAQNRTEISKIKSDVGVIMSTLSDLRFSTRVLEKELESLRRELKEHKK